VVVVLVLGVAAVVTGRVDLAVLAAPFVVGTAVALRDRPRGLPTVSLALERARLTEGDRLRARVVIDNVEPAAPLDLVVVRREPEAWWADERRTRTLAASVRRGERAALAIEGDVLRWGRHTIAPVRAHAFACDALVESRPVTSEPLPVVVFPRSEPFEADDTMPNAAGLVGVHRSRLYGDGGELAGIRQFAPGDRLRRIDWRASLRTRQLHVAQTLSDRDAELVLILDILHEVAADAPSSRVHRGRRAFGLDRSSDGRASVTDTTVRAAAGITQHYAERGDRVRLLEYGGRNRALRAGTGRRHVLTVLEWLLAVSPGEGPHDPSDSFLWRYTLPHAALLVVLTPLVDRRSVALLARLARSGRSILAVDTLPDSVRPPRTSAWSDAAFGLWRLQRQNTVAQLLAHGVPVVRWSGAGSLDLVLRDIARMAAGPATRGR
jgi:uncharacterized protein (DUF58 family)